MKIKIGISSCLLGSKVRYDGGHKFDSLIIDTLEKDFEWVSICPEVEGGLTIPRPPIQIQLKLNSASHNTNQNTQKKIPFEQIDIVQLEIVEVENKNKNHSEKLFNYAKSKIQTLNNISGFIAKSKSPSCGTYVSYYQVDKAITSGPGFFIKLLSEKYPSLPIINEVDYQNELLRSDFLSKVRNYKL